MAVPLKIVQFKPKRNEQRCAKRQQRTKAMLSEKALKVCMGAKRTEAEKNRFYFSFPFDNKCVCYLCDVRVL